MSWVKTKAGALLPKFLELQGMTIDEDSFTQ